MVYDWVGSRAVYIMSPSATLPQFYSYEHALDMDRDRVGTLRESADAADDFTELRNMGLIRKNLDFENIEATITIYKDYNRDTYPAGFDYLYYNQEDCTFRSLYNNRKYYFKKTS